MAVIYGLFDPRKPLELEECRYIGKTKGDLIKRLKEHIWYAATQGKHTYRCDWIRSLLADGVEPVIKQLDEAPEDRINGLERSWIANGRKAEWRLTNYTDGGDGFSGPYPEEGRRKLSEALTRYNKEHPEAAQHRREVQLKRYESQEERDRTGRAIAAGMAAGDKSDKWCPDCGKGPFVGVQGLGNHRKYDHDPQPEHCPDCGDGPFQGRSGVIAHRQHKHQTVKEPLMCECGKGPFHGNHGLGIHRKRWCVLKKP